MNHTLQKVLTKARFGWPAPHRALTQCRRYGGMEWMAGMFGAQLSCRNAGHLRLAHALAPGRNQKCGGEQAQTAGEPECVAIVTEVTPDRAGELTAAELCLQASRR